MGYRAFRAVSALIALAVLSACALPRGAALQSEIVGASARQDTDFAVYPVSRAALPIVAAWPLPGPRHLGWIGASHGSAAQVIAAGDTITLTIWDSSENSLLTAPGARQVVLEGLRVSPAGSIFVPYIGTVRIAGMTAEAARGTVQRALEPISPAAQAQLAVTEGRANSVDLVGGVAAPGIYPMPDRDFNVLSLIAAGGGVDAGLNNPQIRLIRGDRVYGTSIDRLYAEPRRDTLLRGGDQVIVEADDRNFVSIGAAGRETLHAFPEDVLTAMEAVALTGGVDDSRGNPQGVLILREYPIPTGKAAGGPRPPQPRVIFTLDLTSADGLFSARKFPIADGDVIYVTESPVTSTRTVFGLIGSAFGLARTVEG